MEAHLRKEWGHALVVNEAGLRKIWALTETDIGPPHAEIEFSDSIHRKYQTIDNVLNIENSDRKKVQRVEITSRSTSENRIRIVLSNKYRTTVEVDAYGEDDLVEKYGRNLSEIIDGLKPWYSPLCKVDFTYIIWVPICIAIALLEVMTPKNTETQQANDLFFAVKILGILFGGLATIALMIWGLNRLRAIYFPLVSFAIGQGSERYRVQENVRWSVAVAFVVSVAATAFFGFFTSPN